MKHKDWREWKDLEEELTSFPPFLHILNGGVVLIPKYKILSSNHNFDKINRHQQPQLHRQPKIGSHQLINVLCKKQMHSNI